MRRWLASLIIIGGCLAAAGALAAAWGGQGDAPDWATPAARAVKRVSALNPYQDEPDFLNNIDCSPLSYRTVNDSNMQLGCFTQTAFGDIDSDNDMVIYNGTDEAVPLLPQFGNVALAPWPQAGALLELDPAATGGSYVSLYKEPLAATKTLRNNLGQVYAKQLAVAPDLSLEGPDGKSIIINPETLAFSDEGSWLVAEDLNGSFIRMNLATLDVLPFAQAYGSTGSPALLKSQVAVSHDGRYVAIDNEAAGEFKVYDLSSCDQQPVSSLTPLNCQSYDYRSFVSQHIGGLRYIGHVRFVNDGLLSFEAHAVNADADGIYELTPAASISSLIDYLGMGDSYTSGEGAFDYLNGTDTGDNQCHLSFNSYPLLLSRDLFGSGGHSVACSGAKIQDINDMSGDYSGQAADAASWQQLQAGQQGILASVMAGFMPGYVAQERFVKQYLPAAATVSIGGNDIGFGAMLTACVAPKLSLRAGAQDCFNTYESRLEVKNLIDRTMTRWTGLYRDLKAAAPGIRLYAIGYPQVASDTGSCGLNVHLSQAEREFTAETIDYLDGDIEQAAAAAGVSYVDISRALNGHRLCEASSGDVAVNGLTAGNDKGLFGINILGRESYHPNALGQHLIEQAVLEQTRNFSDDSAAGPAVPDSTRLLDAPKSGRTVYDLVPLSMGSAMAAGGQTFSIGLNGSEAGLLSGSAYNVHLDGPGGTVIGSITSDSTGDLNGSVTMPDGAEAGGHQVDVTGTNQAGEPVDVTQPVYVTSSSEDSDGDGIANDEDTCPYAVNSGVDADQDGIDDACDPLIGQPPNPTGPSGTPAGSSSGSLGSANSGIVIAQSADTITSEKLPGGRLNVAAVLQPLGTGGTVQDLGNRTANPVTVSAQPLKLAGKTDKNPAASPLLKLNSFNWLWLILPVLVWWLFVSLLLATD